MADEESSKLKAQIAFLTNLIESHKQTPQASVDRRHVPAVQSSNNNNISAFSWQKAKQPGMEKQHVGTSRYPTQSQAIKAKSSYSLDKRTTSSSISGSNTATTSSNVAAIPGSSRVHPGVTIDTTNALSLKDKLKIKMNSANASTLSASNSAVPSRTRAIHSHVSSPSVSSNVTHTSLSQSSSNMKVKNPYVLNKKDSLSIPSVKTVAKKSDLKWSKPIAGSSVLATDDSRSHSDSELYTKKSSLLSTGQPSSTFFTKGKSPALICKKAPSISNVQGSFKWSKPMSSGKRTSAKKPQLVSSKLKWTNPGVHTQSGTKRQENPLVLRKGTLARATQNQGVVDFKTVNRHKLTKKAVYPVPSQSSLVWRAPGTLKLDRRKVQSTVDSTSKKAASWRSSAGFIERRQRAVLRDNPVVTRYSVVRSKRKQTPIKAQKLNKVVVIEGVPYKTSSNKLRKTKLSSTRKESEGKVTSLSKTRKTGKLSKTVTIQGEKFAMDSKGKTLQRVNRVPQQGSINKASSSKQSEILAGRRRLSNGRMIIFHTPTTLVRSKVTNSQNKTVASRVLRRSIRNARMSKNNKGKPTSEQYCMFYNRFGKCSKQDACPYIHDPSKVAVCTKFLRGRCKNTDGSCPFSHKIDRDKMPVCQFFLRGTCSNDNCPYSHVNVSKKAEVCEDFLKGFCSRGQQCNKKHVLECEEFSRTGKCSKGSKCKLMHRIRKPASRKRKSASKEEKESFKISKLDFTNDEGFLPLTASTSDSDPTLTQEPLENTPEEAKQMAEPLVIRPRFLKPKEPASK